MVGQPRTYYSTRFAIDFAGGDLAMINQNANIKPVIETSAGKIGDRIVTQGMRIDFDAIKRSRLTDRDWGTFAVCSEDAAKRRLDVIQASGMTAGDIMADQPDDEEIEKNYKN